MATPTFCSVDLGELSRTVHGWPSSGPVIPDLSPYGVYKPGDLIRSHTATLGQPTARHLAFRPVGSNAACRLVRHNPEQQVRVPRISGLSALARCCPVSL